MTSASTPRCLKMSTAAGRELVGDENAGHGCSPCDVWGRRACRGSAGTRSFSECGEAGLGRLQLGGDGRRRPSRARASGPRGRRSRPWRRTRCAGPEGRRDSRRRRGPRLPSPAREASFLAKSAWASAGRPVTRGSTTFRQTEVLERIAGSSARKSTQAVLATQASSTARLASARRCSLGQAADAGGPLQGVEVVLDAQHRGRVDGRALEDVEVDLAALGHAEQLRHRPGGRVALQPGHGAGRQDQHAVRGLAAERLLPGEGDDIELGPVERPGRRRRWWRRRS